MNFCIPKKNIYIFILFAVIGAAIYSNTMQVPFLFDDARNIQNPGLRLEKLSSDKLLDVVLGGELKERPVANLSFALNYYMHGYELPGYHVVNVTMHILTAFFLCLFLRHTLSLPVNKVRFGQAEWVAETASVLWLVHPLATQSVTYIVQRMNVLAALFYILALYFYVLARKRQHADIHPKEEKKVFILFSCCAVSGLLAIGSKEIASTLPVFIFLYEWFFFQNLRWEWLKRKMPWLVGLGICFGGLAFVYLDGNPVRNILHGCDWRDFTVQQRLLTQPRVIWHYVVLLFFPHPHQLVFDYNFPISTSLFTPWSTVASIGGIVGALLVAISIAKRERLVAFCILWFFANLAIESSFICLEMVFEHRTYLPSTFIVFLCVLLVSRVMPKGIVAVALNISLIVILSVWTFERNKVYQDPVTFWQDSVAKQPGKARSHNNLGTELYKLGQFEEARAEYDFALISDPEYTLAYNNLGLVELRQENFEKAGQLFRKAIGLLPHYVDAMVRLAEVCRVLGDLPQAEKLLRKAVALAPEYSLANRNLGKVLLKAKKYGEAVKYFEIALEANPDNSVEKTYTGDAYFAAGDADKAREMYEKSLLLDEDQPTVHYNLARIYSAKSDPEKAQDHYQKAVELAPFFTAAHYNLGNALLGAGEMKQAEQHYRQVIENIPLASNALNNIGMIKMREGNTQESLIYFEAAVRVMPENEMAKRNYSMAKEKQLTPND